MSSTAPWLALAVDWDESEMWDSLPQYGIEEESTMGERLAWLCLLCYLCAVGRKQRKFDRHSFAIAYRLDPIDVGNMLRRAESCNAVRYNDGRVVISNWNEWGNGNDGRQFRQKIPVSVRADVLMRDGGQCRYCGRPATSLDHVLPYSRGGSDDPENLVACCYRCNTRKSARTPDEAGMIISPITDA